MVELERNWAHPRSRGENLALGYNGGVGSGSSPLTRGKLPEMDVSGNPLGLIPAHAGKTQRSETGSPCLQAHPRSRGENTHTMREMTNELGSSPLTRGKP